MTRHIYLSFASEDGHLGVVVTEMRDGESLVDITTRVTAAGLNPGGEVRGWLFDMGEEGNPIKPEHCDRLVTLQDQVDLGWEPVNISTHEEGKDALARRAVQQVAN
jgi:hypothetical protein